MASLVAYALAMYLVSVGNKMIMGCHSLLKEILAPPLIMNTNPYGGSPIFKVTHPIRIPIFDHFSGWYSFKL
jgi:hypothetical protein